MAGKLGTHSIRKYSATVARKSGVGKDNLDYRARWKSKRMQDNYVGMELCWPDIHCASKLCKGGFIVYKPREGLGLTDDWIARFIAPPQLLLLLMKVWVQSSDKHSSGHAWIPSLLIL